MSDPRGFDYSERVKPLMQEMVLLDQKRMEEIAALRQQLQGAVSALEQARDLIAQAYTDAEHDDSPGNRAFAVLNAALTRYGGQ